MKRSLLCLPLCLLLICCSAAAETPPPMPTPPSRLQSFTGDLVLYYNPDGGRKYHLDANCASIHHTYLPLSGQFLYHELTNAPYAELDPCSFCGAPLPPAAADACAARLTAFLNAWNENDRAAMLALCSPAWKAQQASPELALFLLLQNRIPLSWEITEQSVEDSMHICTVVAQMNRNDGQAAAKYRFTLRLSMEDNVYCIVPDGLAVSEKLE